MSYTPEFRAEAVRLYRLGQRGLKATAKQIGVSVGALRSWVRQAQIDEGLAQGLTSDDKAELTRLRRENKLLLEEKEILRKAALFFARETDRRNTSLHPVDDIVFLKEELREISPILAGYTC